AYALPLLLPADEAPGLAFSADGSTLAVQWREGLTLWDVRAGRPSRPSLQATGGDSAALALLSDGTTLARAGVGGGELWDAAGGKERQSFDMGGERVHCLAYSPKAGLLAAGGERTLRIGDASTGRERNSFRAPGTRFLAFSQDGTTLAAVAG